MNRPAVVSGDQSEIWQQRLGRARLDPATPVVAGSVGTWTITLVVGSYGVDEGGTIKLAHRFASDWEAPQFTEPTRPGFATVSTTGRAKLSPHYEAKGEVRPWMKALVIDVSDGSLAPGDIVTITLGDRSFGSPGTRAQTFIEPSHEFRIFVDPTNACLTRALPNCPSIAIVAGPPKTAFCCVPTQAVVGASVPVHWAGRDLWGNPTAAPEPAQLQWQGAGRVDLTPDTLVFRAPGTGRVIVESPGGGCASNPITASVAPSQFQRYWGDLHAQTGATIGTGTERDYFTFARDVARLDFASHQGNDFQMTDEDWRRLNTVVREFHEDRRFVVFPGYEWSANTPSGGDRNVFFRHEDLPIIRSSHWQIPGVPEDAVSPAHPADVFFKRLREVVPLKDVIVGSHVGGRYADVVRHMDAELGPLVEISSCWGVFEWLLWDALGGGHVVGVMCNSDGHKGRPGAESPGDGEFGIAGGLTCVLAEALTREAVFDALKRRRCYGTTGPRIDLDLTVNGEPMGAILKPARTLRVAASARGVSALERLQLLSDRQVVHEVAAPEFGQVSDSRRVRVTWGGSKMRGRGRRAIWDGQLSVLGSEIVEARTFAFDSASDGITRRDRGTVAFRSRTTGDCDGIDLWLSEPKSGRLRFASPLGELEVNLADLGSEPIARPLGGLDLFVSVRRYPDRLGTPDLTMDLYIDAGALPHRALLVKAIQVDGAMAWSSPVYAAAGPARI